LAVSSELKIVIYRFVIVGPVEHAAPTVPQQIAEPLWKLSPGGTRIVLSEGFSDDIATYFVVKARSVLGLVIPHNENQLPYFRLLMDFDPSKWTNFATGFEKALTQDADGSSRRLSFSWQAGITGSCSPSLSGGINSTSYPSMYYGSRVPQLDEETGRIVQDSLDSFQVVDTAVVYSNMESEEF
jgi:hypothetical protein